jgi:agmatinase
MTDTPGDAAFRRTDLYGSNPVDPTYSGALSFLRRKYTRELEGVDVAVTGIPYDLATTNRPGTRFGPAAIRQASAQLAWQRPYLWADDPLDKLAVIDYGDCAFDFGVPQDVPGEITEHARQIVGAGVKMISLGGDHFITYPLLKAHVEAYGPLSLVHFDAHSDTWRDDGKRIDHGTMFFHSAQEGLVDPARSVHVGIRTHNDETHGFTILDAPSVIEKGAGETVAEIRRIVGENRAYLTFDIDCLDPSYAPGTGTPVVGGLSSALALQILRGLAGMNFVGMDIVEVAPAYDVGDVTALAGATIAHNFLSLLAAVPAAD